MSSKKTPDDSTDWLTVDDSVGTAADAEAWAEANSELTNPTVIGHTVPKGDNPAFYVIVPADNHTDDHSTND